jgi:outer membrane protein assembly factor BamA
MRTLYIGFSFLILLVLSPVIAAPIYALENTQETTEVSFFVDAINISGNIKTSFDFILNNLTFSSGSTIRFDEIEESRLKLEATWLFSSVNLSFKKGREKGHVIVEVALIEYDSLTYGANLGFGQRVLQGDTLKYDNYIGFWANNSNLFGYGKTGELGINRYASTPFSRGVINGTYDILMLKAQYIDPKLFQSSKYFFKINTTFIDFGHESSSRYQMGAELGRRLISEHYFSFGGFYTPPSEKLDSDKEVFIAYGFDNQDDAIFPTSGSAYVLRLSCGTYRGIGKEGRIKYDVQELTILFFMDFLF